MAFDVEGARKAGYTNAEIAGFLAKGQGFDVAGARKAGYSDAEIVQHLNSAGSHARTGAAAIPTADEMATGVYTPPAAAPAAPQPGIGDQIVGAGETALHLVTGATGGPLGMAGGTIKGLAGSVMRGDFGTPQAAQRIEQAAAEGAQELTYAPRTAAGQQQAEAVGDVLQQVVPVMPLTGELAAASRAAQPIKMAARDAGTAAAEAAKGGARQAGERAMSAVQRISERGAQKPTPGTLGSVGAAGADLATQRQAVAADLPAPVRLTKGQADRSFEQLRFEQETAKNPNMGAPLRERYAEQNQAILNNFDAWVDQTGAEAPSLRAVGAAVDKALVDRAARDKAEIRVAYKNAEKAGEMLEPVATDGLVQMLNEAGSAEAVAPVISAARKELVRLGGASVDEAGVLAPGQLTLGDMELMRRFTNKVTGTDATNIKFAGDIKRAIDATTEGLGGEIYSQARKLRQRYAQNYENRGTIAKLLDEKRGLADRAVAFEDVFSHSILKGSLDDVRNVRRVLHRAGGDGQQAWRELQGATMGWIKDEATRGVATDQRGNPIVSAAGLNKAIRSLDHDGKLEFVFGKKGAQQLRDLNDLAKVVYTAPPGAVNTSNTASVLLAALAEAGTWGGATGLPVPVLTGLRQVAIKVKDRRIQKRVEEALQTAKKRARGDTARRETNRPIDESTAPKGETIH